MYHKILVPLDGSKLAEAVLPFSKIFAHTLKLPVVLIHVSDPETVAPSLQPNQAGEYLRAVATSLLGSLSVDCAVKSGAAAEMILDSAAGDPATLITMATHGQSGGKRWLLGRVAQKVLQVSKSPLLIIRPQAELTAGNEVELTSVIVPLDGSHLAEKIFSHVTYLAKNLGLQVVLVRTYALPSASYFLAAHVSPPDMAMLREKLRRETSDYMQAKVERLTAAGVANITAVVAEGSGPEEIIELARKRSANMVAMSTHGRSGIGRWVLGSVTDRVVSDCGAPVLVVRPEPV